jgi:hypothetical protein
LPLIAAVRAVVTPSVTLMALSPIFAGLNFTLSACFRFGAG